MHTKVAEMLDIEFPIFAFSHCRDVVAAVTNAGGVGVLGTTRQSVEELEYDLRWLEEQVGGKPYAVDVLFPSESAGDDLDALWASIPKESIEFVADLRRRFGIPEPKDAGRYSHQGDNLIPTHLRARQKLDVVLDFAPKLLASALGPTPADIVEAMHARGSLIVGLVGAPGQATKHIAAGTDIIVAQGTEAGGHTGEISTLVLVPQVVDEAGSVPVLAAGGIGDGRQIAAAIALGAHGVWTGSIWLATVEADVEEEVTAKLIAASSRDTVRSRCLTGKPIRQLNTPWVAAWTEPGAPSALPAPMQGMLVRDTMTGIFDHRVSEVMGTAVGQIVGTIKDVRRARRVIEDLIEEYVEASMRVAELLTSE
ncbi:MAG TPA: nitronate monooxygenase family protein [Ilumatobacter sp.]|nr:nitronate monooxygenase family protein [Ilumatobacter sp.]